MKRARHNAAIVGGLAVAVFMLLLHAARAFTKALLTIVFRGVIK